MVNKEPRTTSKEIICECQRQGTSVSDCTICRCLSQSRLNGRQLRRAPLLKTNHKKSRWEFVKIHIDKPQSLWLKVLWIHMTKLSLLANHISSMFTKAKMKLGKKRTPVPTVKHGGGLVMSQGCFGACGTGCLKSVWLE